jgi:hypothetical protein
MKTFPKDPQMKEAAMTSPKIVLNGCRISDSSELLLLSMKVISSIAKMLEFIVITETIWKNKTT